MFIFMLNPVIMKLEDYFQKEGEIAFRIWGFMSMLNSLKENPNLEKAQRLYDKIITFSDSPWMEIKATQEERDDLQKVIDEVTLLTVA